uniref:Uncharacterized protein n=1 Tax=Papilio xuthus TaxID=66420 RepID=I4DQG9_PAPXU|nr:unknown unsecreted protein [Papilio xuthus]
MTYFNFMMISISFVYIMLIIKYYVFGCSLRVCYQQSYSMTKSLMWYFYTSLYKQNIEANAICLKL